VRTGQIPQARQEPGGWAHHAAFTLDGLDDHGGGLVVDGRRSSVQISVWHEDHVTGQRFERLAVLGGRRQRERSHRPAVEGALHGDDLRPAGEPGDLEGCLVGFGARVREIDPGRSICGAAGGQLGQPLTQFDLRDGREEVRDMAEGCHLLADRPDDGRVGLTQPADRDAAEHVGIAIAIGVPQRAALAAYEDGLRQAEIVHHGALVALQPLRLGGHHAS